jgi:hypothetical protein
MGRLRAAPGEAVVDNRRNYLAPQWTSQIIVIRMCSIVGRWDAWPCIAEPPFSTTKA